MKATLNLKRPCKPIEIKLSTIKAALWVIIISLANLVAFVWGASAYKADYDHRLESAESSITSLEEVPARLSSIEGKVDVILDMVRK